MIVDLFYGQFKSKVTCKKCDNNSTTFDPYLAISVPIPSISERKVSVTVWPRDLALTKGIVNLEVYVSENATFNDLKEMVSKALDLKYNLLVYIQKDNLPKDKCKGGELIKN